ncbi:hypothetical protein COX97_04655 [Candidatus Pacearchaeota archaeon CG_4_10_14_0_2_um_filter_05_32_18]|nr:MAG: hypothetical protein AUJ62_00355 [Candidatus Pacearchaeota archaeon CG1_02_32_21]PIZ82481.1 MAG: hypothetical protein COX97_04655 [Candidatus Pacearchaeota archaeon CG_4_10_14_0_2_um_filter_05_32_18]
MLSYFHIILIVILVSLIFLFVRLKYIKHKLVWVILLVFVLLVYLGFILSIAGQNINLKTPEGAKLAINLYVGWMGNSFTNLKVLSGQAIKLDWRSLNKTDSNQTNDPLNLESNRDKYRKRITK